MCQRFELIAQPLIIRKIFWQFVGSVTGSRNIYCKNQSSSMTRARDIQGDRLCSSLITWVPVIGSVDKIACSRGQQTNLTG